MYTRRVVQSARGRSATLVGTAAVQLLGGLYLGFTGLVAFEMSALLGGTLLVMGLALSVTAAFLVTTVPSMRSWRWAYRVSLGLVVCWLLGCLALGLAAPVWLGLVHAAPAALILAGLVLSRPGCPAM